MDRNDAGPSMGRYAWATAFLEQHGIPPHADGYSKQQLIGELERHGWQWEVEPGEVRAFKHPTSSPTSQHDVVSTGANLIENLVMVLAGAIDYDETGSGWNWTRH